MNEFINAYTKVDRYEFYHVSRADGTSDVYVYDEKFEDEHLDCLNDVGDKKTAVQWCKSWIQDKLDALRGTCEWEIRDRLPRSIITECGSKIINPETLDRPSVLFCPYCGRRVARKEE